MERDAESLRAALRISCAEALDLTTDFLEQAMTPRQREEFAQHLRGCRPCTVYLDQMRRTIIIAGAMADPGTVDDASMERLIHLFRRLRDERS